MMMSMMMVILSERQLPTADVSPYRSTAFIHRILFDLFSSHCYAMLFDLFSSNAMLCYLISSHTILAQFKSWVW